jgi:hypothetical protein
LNGLVWAICAGKPNNLHYNKQTIHHQNELIAMDAVTPPVLRRGLSDEQHLSQPESPAAVKINVQRIANALAGQTISAPQGMSREEKRQFIMKQALSQ